jgi:uncharacterized protein (TIGR04255 family)
MTHKDLKNKPLVEAILEVKWQLGQTTETSDMPQIPLAAVDPHYRLLLGRLFDRFQEDYPVHEQLPTATLPDEIVGHVIQHRFRAAKDDWPLIQVGPGVFTVNETYRYTWPDFQQRVRKAVGRLFDAHPNVSDLRIQSLVLRYIDAVEFNYQEESAFAFLRDKLKVGINLPRSLFQDTGVSDLPRTFSWQATFQCSRPRGSLHVGFATGRKEKKPAILWETAVHTSADELPKMPDDFPTWLDAANETTHDWFFKLIEGELERRFEGGE